MEPHVEMEMEPPATQRLGSISDARVTPTRVWTLHGDQRLVGVCCEQSVASLVASGERHVQIRSLSPTSTVGKLVPFESERCVLRPAQGAPQRYYVSFPRGGGSQERVRLLDAVAMEFVELGGTEDALTNSSGRLTDVYSIQDGCVDADGQCVALVEAQKETDERTAVWRLRCWSRTDHERRALWTTTPAQRDIGDHHVWAMRFITTTLFGQCLMVVRLAHDQTEWTLQLQLFNVSGSESGWTLVRQQRSGLQLPSSSAYDIQLSPSCRWLALYTRDASKLHCVPLDLFVSQRPALSMELDAPVADVAWHDDALAVLSTRGHVHFRRPQSSELAQVSSPIDASSLPGPQSASSSAWHRVEWVEQGKRMLFSSGPCVVEVSATLDLEMPEFPPPDEPITSRTEPFEMSTPPHRRRRRRRQQPSASTSLSRDIDRIVASPASETTLVELLDAIRLTTQSNDQQNLDIAFTLLGILLQRVLQRLGFTDTGNTDDLPIQIGIVEMLVAQVVAGDAVGVHQTAETVAQAPAFRSRLARRSYYARELQWVAATAANDLTSYSFVSTFPSFVESALSHATELLNGIDTSAICEPVSGVCSASHARQIVSEMENPTTTPVSPWLKLQALVLACAATCEFYHIDCVVLDVDLLRAVLTQLRGTPGGCPGFRQDFVRRFLSLQSAKLQVHAMPSHDDTNSSASVALRLANHSGFLSQFIQFCSTLNVSEPYALLLAHQSHHQSKHKREIDPRISRAIAKAVIDQCISDLISMLRHAPLLPLHKRDLQLETQQPLEAASSIDQFVKLVFVSTDPSAAVSDDASLLGLAPSSLSLSEDEAILRTNSLRLVRLVMQQLRYLIRLASDSQTAVDSDAAMNSVLRDLFLFDSLWTTTRESRRSNADRGPREAMLFLRGLQESQSKVSGRIAGTAMAHTRSTDALPPHLLRTLRALVVVLWSHWIRERCSVVKVMLDARAPDQEGSEDGQRLGAMAAWCALQLKTLALYRDENDAEELLALQLWLLDAAASLDPHATSRVLQWGFAADSINARYQRRFRFLRAAVAECDTNEDDVDQYKRRLRNAVRRDSQSADDFDHSALEGLDALGTCCCDTDFQRVVWALVQRRFLVVSSAGPNGCDTDHTEIKKALQSRPSSVDGLISRHEVVQLLKAQRLEIEQQMERVQRETVKTTSSVKQTATSSPSLQAEVRPQPTVAALRLKSHSVRDLIPPPRVDETKERSSSPTKSSLRKGSSTQNVLKLLQLRKDQQQLTRHQSAPRLVPENLTAKQDPEPVKAPARAAPSQPTPMPVRKRPMQPRPPPPPPLRHDHVEQAEHAELVLLTVASGGSEKRKSVPLKRKSFRLETIPPVNGLSHLYQIPLDAEGEEIERLKSQATQCTTLKTTSVQTEAEKDEETLAAVPTTASATSGISVVTNVQPTKTDDVGVQSEATHSASEGVNQELVSCHAASLAARFPVYVDLPEPAAATRGRTYLHVATIPAELGMDKQKPPERVKIVTAQMLEPRAAEATGPSNEVRSNAHVESADAENSLEKLKQLEAQRRQTYRSHFASATAQQPRGLSGSSVGMESFVSLKSEMERMKAKLLELETGAKDLDDEFKVSHETLETMERRRATHALEQVDDAIAESAVAESESVQGRGVLSTKATRDLAGARHLLAQIEQLTALHSERGDPPHT